jgi:hypothetical protein
LDPQRIGGNSLQMKQVGFGPAPDVADFWGIAANLAGLGLDPLQMQRVWGEPMQMQRFGFGPAADAVGLWGLAANEAGWVCTRCRCSGFGGNRCKCSGLGLAA